MVAGAVAGFVIGTYLLRTNPNFYIRPIYWVQTLLGAADVDAAMSGYGHDVRDLLSTRVRYLAEWVVPAGIGALLAPELLIASSPLFIYLFTRQDEWASWEGPYIHWTAPALALVAAAVYHQFQLWNWFIEDAAISFSYARNLADGGGLVTSVGHERVEGYSNPSWVFLLA